MGSLSTLWPLLESHREQVIDRLTARITAAVPQYAIVGAVELRRSVSQLFDDLGRLVTHGERESLSRGLAEAAARRLEGGFQLGDYTRAILLAIPVAREVVRRHGPMDDPALAGAIDELEALVHEHAVQAAGVYHALVARQLEGKNQALHRLNAELDRHGRALEREVGEASRALESARALNERVLASLTAGVMVVGDDERVRLFTTRAEQILGLPVESVLGRPVREALAGIGGLDVAVLVDTVRQLGRLPLTRLRLDLPGGRPGAVHVRAQRLSAVSGESGGTVVVLDDVTERELLVEAFSRYVSGDLLGRVLARGKPLEFEGERRFGTILFADLRNFAALAESHPPEVVHELLNSYLRVTIDSVILHFGFIDKILNDKLMAVFTVGREPADSAAAALRAALELKRRAVALGEERKAAGLPVTRVGVGVASGEVLIGNVGSARRMDFTAIGDTVNIADRLQKLARDGEVLVAAETARLVTGRFRFRDRGSQQVVGRQAQVQVLELEGGAD